MTAWNIWLKNILDLWEETIDVEHNRVLTADSVGSYITDEEDRQRDRSDMCVQQQMAFFALQIQCEFKVMRITHAFNVQSLNSHS